MAQGRARPSNAILVSGNPVVEELEVKTAANMYPGRFVIKDTNDWDIKVAGAGAKNVLGILDVEPGELKATIYDAGDQARVLRGAGVCVVAHLASGQNVAKGAALICAANGELTAASDIAVAVPAGATAVTSKSAQPDLAESGSIPPSGIIVGYAAESVDASAEAKDIMVYLAI